MRRSGRGSTKRATSFQVIAVLWIVVAVGVICAIYLAPKKPPPPPASRITYTEKPDREAPAEAARPGSPAAPREPVSAVKAPVEAPRPAAREPETRFLVQGVVTDAKTHAPVDKARVSCQWRGGGSAEASPEAQKPYMTYTNGQGRYVIDVECGGTYDFEVSRNGYISLRHQQGTLEAAAGELCMDFALSRGASIAGRVTESGTNRGAEGVILRALGPERSETVADEEGKYELTGFPPGAYEVRLDLSKAPYTASGMAPAKNVTIAHDRQEVMGINFQVDAAGEVWGYVVTRDGEAVGGTNVLLCTSSSMISQLTEASITQAPPLHGRSEKDGYYEIIGVPLKKEWRLYAMATESAPQLTAPFLLMPGQRSARIDIYVSPGTTVYGEVVSTDQTPVDKADVLCIPSYSKFFSPFDSPQAFRSVKSTEDGSFSLPNLPVGEYQILARKDGFKFAATGAPIYPDGYSDIRGVEVMLTPVAGGEFTVYGTVMDTQGRPIEGADLALAAMGVEELSAGTLTASSDAGGQYAFTQVSPGFLMLVVEKEGYESQNVTNVRLDEPTDVTLETKSMVRGVVLVRETGKPVENFRVQSVMLGAQGSTRPVLAQMISGASGQTFSNAQGHFNLALAPGLYTLEAKAVGLTPGRTEVEVEAGEDLDGVEILLSQAGARIEGRVVVTQGGQSPQGALVWVGTAPTAATPEPGAVDSGAEPEAVQVGEDGAFEFANLTADTYYVFGRLAGYAQGMAGPIQVGEGQTQSGVVLELGVGSALEGYVAFDGRLTAGAIVMAAGLENGVTEMATSDEQGQYRIEKLPPGPYLASAVRIGGGGSVAGLFSPLHARVEIVEGVTTVHNFGEPTNTAVIGLLTPPPPAGTIAYAILHLPGVPIDIAALNVANPMSWLGDASSLANFVVNLAPIERDGYFRMDNLAEGEYQIEIVYSNLGDVLASGGGVSLVYSGPVLVTEGQTSELNIPVPTQGAQGELGP